MRRRPENFHPSFMIGFPRLRRLRRISRKRNGFSSASVLAGSPGLVLPGRRCRGVVLLVFSWHQLASRSPDAAGGLLHRPGLPPAAVVLVPLDEALWLSVMQQTTEVRPAATDRKPEFKLPGLERKKTKTTRTLARIQINKFNFRKKD